MLAYTYAGNFPLNKHNIIHMYSYMYVSQCCNLWHWICYGNFTYCEQDLSYCKYTVNNV